MHRDDPAPAADEIGAGGEIPGSRGRDDGLRLEPGPALGLFDAPLLPGRELGLAGRRIPEEDDMGPAPELAQVARLSGEVDHLAVARRRPFFEHGGHYIALGERMIVSRRNFTLLSSRSRWKRTQASKIWRISATSGRFIASFGMSPS